MSESKPSSKETKLDSHTYGNSKAAEVLAKLLKKYDYNVRAVGRHWGDYSHTMTELCKWVRMDTAVRLHLADLFHHDMMNTLDECNLETDVRTYLKNVMAAKWKQTQKKLSTKDSPIATD